MHDYNEEDKCVECELREQLHSFLANYVEHNDISLVQIIGMLEIIKTDLVEMSKSPDDDSFPQGLN